MLKIHLILILGAVLVGCGSPQRLATGHHTAVVRVNGTPVMRATAKGAVHVSREEGVSSESDLHIDLTEPTRPSVHSDSAPLTPSKNPWRNLRKGMTPADVQAALGEPKHVTEMGYTTWEYPAAASVFFREGALEGWSEPREEFR